MVCGEFTFQAKSLIPLIKQEIQRIFLPKVVKKKVHKIVFLQLRK